MIGRHIGRYRILPSSKNSIKAPIEMPIRRKDSKAEPKRIRRLKPIAEKINTAISNTTDLMFLLHLKLSKSNRPITVNKSICTVIISNDNTMAGRQKRGNTTSSHRENTRHPQNMLMSADTLQSAIRIPGGILQKIFSIRFLNDKNITPYKCMR